MHLNRKFTGLMFQMAGGGAAYNLLELCWRQYTHISMTILGGLCFCALVKLSQAKMSFFAKSIVGGTFITVSEFITGCAVNLWLGLDVWDYSKENLSLLGQVCPRFFLIWCLLSAVVIHACGMLSKSGMLARLPGLSSRGRQSA